MDQVTFLHPQFFWLLLLLPVAVLWHLWKRKQAPALQMPTLQAFKVKTSLLAKLKPVLFVLRLLALTSLIIALARPRTQDVSARAIRTQGIDIVIAMDVSLSMLAEDLKPNRMEALKNVAVEFVDNRPNDRIGVVVYAAESYTATPVTTDHDIVKRALKSIKYYDNVIKDGTAIGTGLVTAVNRLKDSKAKSKVVILLTDGENNSGLIAPGEAADIAKNFDIKVYTIGIGTTGMAWQPTGKETPDRRIIYHFAPVKIDEDLMKSIASKTGGKYFRATDNNNLKAIYNEIDKLEKSEIKDKRYLNYIEKFFPFVWAALLLVMLEIILRKTIYKSIV